MIEVHSLRIGPEKNFTYLILCTETHQAALIDPSFEQKRIFEWVKSKSQPNIKMKYLIATHGHWDHAGGFPEMLKYYPNAQVVAHELERDLLHSLHVSIDIPLDEAQKLPLGNSSITALHTPGHTQGGCCYLINNFLFTGDTLFIGQCGRTDLETGSNDLMFHSLQRLKTMPDDWVVYPGHDYGKTPTATLGSEKKSNPSLLAQNFQEFMMVP